MSLVLPDRTIERVIIVDDDKDAREGYGYSIEEAGVEFVLQNEPISSIRQFLSKIDGRRDAVLSDYHLKKHHYASTDGDELVAACYRANVPSMLCSTFTDMDVTLSKKNLRYIPALLKTSSPEPSEVIQALSTCVSELNGTFTTERKPWRTQVKIVDIVDDGKYFYAVVHAWSANQKIRIYRDDIPEEIDKRLQPGSYFHAKVNIGAEKSQHLYFESWETA